MEYGVKTMSETSKEQTSSQIKVKQLEDSDWVAAAKKLETVWMGYINEYAGKSKMNPFFFIEKTLRPLRERLDNNEKSQELYNTIMALEVKEENAAAPKVLPEARDYSKYYQNFLKRG